MGRPRHIGPVHGPERVHVGCPREYGVPQSRSSVRLPTVWALGALVVVTIYRSPGCHLTTLCPWPCSDSPPNPTAAKPRATGSGKACFVCTWPCIFTDAVAQQSQVGLPGSGSLILLWQVGGHLQSQPSCRTGKVVLPPAHVYISSRSLGRCLQRPRAGS